MNKDIINFKKTFGNWVNDESFLYIIKSDYFRKLIVFLNQVYNKRQIFPLKKDIFKVFRYVPYNNIKVVILGDSPYPNESANGFAVANTVDTLRVSPSLFKIRECIEKTTNTLIVDFDVTLQNWALQNVLLLNTSLTIQAGMVNPHKHIWDEFIKVTINTIIDNNPGVIFCLWGNDVMRTFHKVVPENKLKFCYALKCIHPELAAKRNEEWNCNHFKQINELIKENNGKEFCIKW